MFLVLPDTEELDPLFVATEPFAPGPFAGEAFAAEPFAAEPFTAEAFSPDGFVADDLADFAPGNVDELDFRVEDLFLAAFSLAVFFLASLSLFVASLVARFLLYRITCQYSGP